MPVVMEATDFLKTTQAATAIPPKVFVAHITHEVSNATSSFFSATSAKDIALLPFRFVLRVDRVLFKTIPNFVIRSTNIATNRTIGALAGIWTGGAIIHAGGADVGAGVMADVAGQAAAEQAVAQVAEQGWSVWFTEAFQASTFKSYWGMLHYATSRWALLCFIMSLILNRVHVYGAARQRVFLTWNRRLALRVIPILLFFTQIRQLLQAIRCQTSPDFALYRHGDLNKYSLLDWSQEGGFMHKLTSTMLWWSDDQAACAALGMSRTVPGVRAAFGSFSLLWPTFLKLSLSHFVENLSCSLQQIAIQTEVGMSVFEHSLAFAEAETMIAHAMGFGSGSGSSPSSGGATLNSTSTDMRVATNGTIPASGTILFLTDTASSLGGFHILNKVNIPVEVLIVALLSCCNAFSSQIISVLGQQKRLRLINTGFWGILFMAAFVWGFFTTSSMVRTDGMSEPRAVSGLLHFPTVAIIGFLPHMMVVLGVLVCAAIYLTALLLTAISLGTNPNIRQPSSLSERISIAHDNLQAAIQIKGVTFKWHEDFYTALLRFGFAALTAASEAVFLNEGRAVEMRQFTWLEEERIDELEISRSGHTEGGRFQIAEEYGLPPSNPGGNDKGGKWESGYAKERKFDKKEGQLQADGTFVYPNPRDDGVGALQRTTRFYLVLIYVRGIMLLTTDWLSYGIGKLLDSVGITARPRFLSKLVGKSLRRKEEERRKLREEKGTKLLEFWLVDKSGKLTTPKNEDYDIEPEIRRRIVFEQAENIDEALDEKIYDWWKLGGWFGTTDTSGEYQPQEQDQDDDTTSVISMSTNASNTDDEHGNGWESESDGRQTPTQERTYQSWSFPANTRRSPTPDAITDTPLDAATLARLLNPQDRSTKEEARILAAHLAHSVAQPGRIVTRSQYHRETEGDRSRVLLAGRVPNIIDTSNAQPDSSRARPLTAVEEAEVLEHLILSRRKQNQPHRPAPVSGTEDDEANRMTGPPCVVCQSSPRTVIAWPCRCLALCEDCRVSLAMNNFGNCVTCRRNIGGFVRLYIP